MKTCGLNGWQRLGVVATVGWVFVVLVAVATSWNPHGMQNWLHVRPLPFQPDPLGLDMADLVWSRLAGLLGLPITLLWAVGFACAWIRSGFECGVEAPYLKPRRLQDVLALVQVLAVDVFSHRSEKWLCEELQRKPLSVKTWKALAGEHPELFRVSGTETPVSLVLRHASPKDAAERQPLSADQVSELLNLAIHLHDRQLQRVQVWQLAIPVIVAVIAGASSLIVGVR